MSAVAQVWLAGGQALQATGLLFVPSAVICSTAAAAGTWAADWSLSAATAGCRMNLVQLGLLQAICVLLVLLPSPCALVAAACTGLNLVTCTWPPWTRLCCSVCLRPLQAPLNILPANAQASACLPLLAGYSGPGPGWVTTPRPCLPLLQLLAPGVCCRHKHCSGTLPRLSAHLLQVLAWSGCGPGWRATQKGR